MSRDQSKAIARRSNKADEATERFRAQPLLDETTIAACPASKFEINVADTAVAQYRVIALTESSDWLGGWGRPKGVPENGVRLGIEAGVTDHIWSIEEIVGVLDSGLPFKETHYRIAARLMRRIPRVGACLIESYRSRSSRFSRTDNSLGS